MDRLSSCYFCGTAVDAPLDEYPVVPEDLDPDPERNAEVTLCPTCRRKFADVMDRVVDAATAPDGRTEEPDRAAGEAAGSASLAPEGTDEQPGDAPDDEPGAGATDDVTPLAGTGTDDAPDSDLSVSDAGTEGGDPLDDVSVQSYNRVARLLRNRAFPVDRGELRAIATSAYEMSAAEFDAVVDAAIERGQLADEDGTLVRPEE